MSAWNEAPEEAPRAEVVTRRFAAAPADLPTTVLVGFTMLIMGALVLGGSVQLALAVGEGGFTGAVRGVGFGLLGVVVIVLVLARVPTLYRLDEDPARGTLLVIERRCFAPVRLVLARYKSAEGARRVVFPWVPLLSGSRFLGLRGAKLEESITGFWSFGRNGRRAVVFSGNGRPRTLISPLDPRAFFDAIRQSPDLARLTADEAVETAASLAPVAPLALVGEPATNDPE